MDALEILELEHYRRFFDKKLLEKYPDTLITRHSDFNKEIKGVKFTDEQDKIYFDRLAEIEKEHEGTEMYKRFDELQDIEITEGLTDCLNIIKQKVIDELSTKGIYTTMYELDKIIEQERAEFKQFLQYLKDNNLLSE